MTAFWAILTKELRLLWRDPGALIMLFVLPALFIIVLAVALQGAFTSDKAENRLRLGVVNLDRGERGAEVVRAVVESNLFREVHPAGVAARDRVEMIRRLGEGELDLVMVLPPETTSAALLDEQAMVEVFVDPVVSRPVADAAQSAIRTSLLRLNLDRLRLRLEDAARQADDERAEAKKEADREKAKAAKCVDEVDRLQQKLDALARMARGGPGGPAPKTEATRSTAPAAGDKKEEKARARIATIDESKGLRVRQSYVSGSGDELRPTSVQQTVPGWTIFALFWLSQLLALNLLSERASGTYARIRVAPVSSVSYLTGKLVPFLAINLLQAVAMFAVGVLVLPRLGCPRLQIVNPGALALLTLCVSLVSLGFGMFMASVSKSSFMVASVSAALLIIMTVLAGIVVPKYIMPASMQRLTLLVPQGWALDGFLKILVKGFTLRQVWPELRVLLGFAAALFAFALWRLRPSAR